MDGFAAVARRARFAVFQVTPTQSEQPIGTPKNHLKQVLGSYTDLIGTSVIPSALGVGGVFELVGSRRPIIL